MRKFFFYAILILPMMLSIDIYAQKSVVLSVNNDLAHINCSGTTTVSGPNAVVYGYKDMFNLRQTRDQYTFYSEICVSYDFVRGEIGRGRILNVTDKTARMRVICIDGYGLASNTLIIEVQPKTFSRIIFDDYDRTTSGVVNQIKCELLKLY